MKKALVIGIDDYSAPNRLEGCVNDAVKLAEMLETNGDGSPNFEVRKVTSRDKEVTTKLLNDAVKDLFTGDADTVLLYFAGHGIMDEETDSGFLVTQDGQDPAWGVNLSMVLQLANKAYPQIKSTVILLDSCQSGFTGKCLGWAKAVRFPTSETALPF